MRISIDLDLPGLGDALAKTLLQGVPVAPTSLALTDSSLRIDGVALGVKKVSLTGRVTPIEGGARISDFDVEGASLFKGGVLDALRGRLATLDERSGPFRVKGSADGDELTVRWA
jgi:hypothetical protein